MLQAPFLSNSDISSIMNKEIESRSNFQANNYNNNINYNNTNEVVNRNANELNNNNNFSHVKSGAANVINFPPRINNQNFNSTNTLDGLNFDSENTCKDMLEQVKKVVEYNTNFINRNNATENKSGNNQNASLEQKPEAEGSHNHNNYRTSNSLYSNSNFGNNYHNNNYYAIENVSPLNNGTTRDNTASSSNNLNKFPNKNPNEKFERDLHSKKNYVNSSNINQNTNVSDNVNINHNYSKYALFSKNNGAVDHVNNIMFTGGNPFRNINTNNSLNQNNLEINSFNAEILTGNFNNPDSTQALRDIISIEKTLDNSKINNQQPLNNISTDSRLSNINLLQDYKISLDGKINNLKKIINQKMGYSKFKNLSNEIFINILNYFNTYDIYAVMNMNSYMKHKIIAILTDSSRVICNEFEKKFNKNFLLKNSQILITNVKKNRKLYSNINLVLKFQIVDTSLKNKTIILGFLNKYYGETNCLKNFFRFDVRIPGPISFWVMREYTSVIYFIINQD